MKHGWRRPPGGANRGIPAGRRSGIGSDLKRPLPPRRSTGREAAGRAQARSLRQRLLTLAAGLLAAAALVTAISLLTRQGIEPRTIAANLDVEVQRRGIDVTIFSAGENQEPTLLYAGRRLGTCRACNTTVEP